MSNPFLTLQERLETLVRTRPYFAELAAEAIVTEKIADIESKVAETLLPLGFGLVITTAKGDGVSTLSVAKSRETLAITIIHNPTLDPDHNALDAVHELYLAVTGKPVIADRQVRNEDDAWRYTGHVKRDDAPPELHVHQVIFTASIYLG